MLMFAGALIYSFIIGSSSSFMSQKEIRLAKYNRNLYTLLSIRKEYNISGLLYAKVKNSLKYGNK